MNKTHVSIALLLVASTIAFWFKQPEPKRARTDELIVGTNSEYPPFTSLEQAEIVGFDIDVIRAVAQHLGKKVVFEDMAFEALIPKLQQGRIQVIAAGMTPTPERAKRVSFTTPHLQGKNIVILTLRKHQPLAGLQDLKGKKVAVNEGYTAETYMDSKDHGATLLRLPTPPDALLALQNEQVYAFVTAQPAIQGFFAKNNQDQFNVFEIADQKEDVAFVVSPKHQELQAQIEQALKELKEDGTLDNLIKKWNLK